MCDKGSVSVLQVFDFFLELPNLNHVWSYACAIIMEILQSIFEVRI